MKEQHQALQDAHQALQDAHLELMRKHLEVLERLAQRGVDGDVRFSRIEIKECKLWKLSPWMPWSFQSLDMYSV